MPEDSIILKVLSGALGGLIVLGVQVLCRWFTRPLLTIDIEEYQGAKPYVHDLSLQNKQPLRIRQVRAVVKNRGGQAATLCEAKLVVERKKDSYRYPGILILNWLRRDARIYSEESELFQSITINSHDQEPLNLLTLVYTPKSAFDTPEPGSTNPVRDDKPGTLQAASFPVYEFDSDLPYELTINVYAGNDMPTSARLVLKWDGTVEGIRTCLSSMN